MAFEIGDLGNFGKMKLPKSTATSITPNLGQAPREIDLTKEEEQKVEEVKEIFFISDLTVESLFNLFNDWQSNKTKATKRFVLSVSFILSLTIFAGVNITEIDLFGVSVADGMEEYFLGSLSLIIIMTFAYYDYLRRNDLKVHKAKISAVSDNLEVWVNNAEELEKIVSENNLGSVKILLDDFRSTFAHGYPEYEAFKAIKFYQDNLKNPRKSHELLNSIEFYGMYILGLTGLLAIIFSF